MHSRPVLSRFGHVPVALSILLKMYGQTVYAVHAILGACASTGWD
jgi:hypothetical protein